MSNTRTTSAHAWGRTHTGCTDARRTYARRNTNAWCTNACTRQNPNSWGANINRACHTANRYAGARAIDDLSAGYLHL
jgi:hypothetical protein